MIIGIGGVSTAGKTTTASIIRNLFPFKRVSILCQDDFVKDVNLIPRVADRVDWEHPDSIDHERLLSAVMVEREMNEIVIAEGLMIFYTEALRKIFDRKIFVSIDYDTFMQRKAFDNRWGHEPEWYIRHIWESYLNFGRIEASAEVLFLDGRFTVKPEQLFQYLSPE